MKQELHRLIVRMPDDMKGFIASQAVKNGSSQNSEVIRALRERMDRVQREEMPAAAGN